MIFPFPKDSETENGGSKNDPNAGTRNGRPEQAEPALSLAA
jgi:hypothetical protein